MAKREIKIQRNIIENSLMYLKNLIKKNRKAFIYIVISIILVVLLLIAGFIIYDKKESNDLATFEKILEDYKKKSGSDAETRQRNLKETVKDLNQLIDSSYWGFVNENGYYVIGNLLYEEKMYRDAKKYSLRFVDKSPSSFFAPLALQQAARSAEMLGDLDEAFNLYKRLESEYGDSEIADHIYYDLGRIYGKRGDKFKAREYYNKLIISYPKSMLAERARKNLFLLGYIASDNE
jgi:tetratricopeptide (TPR) repeat protein